jgi:hypothetical protein
MAFLATSDDLIAEGLYSKPGCVPADKNAFRKASWQRLAATERATGGYPTESFTREDGCSVDSAAGFENKVRLLQ